MRPFLLSCVAGTDVDVVQLEGVCVLNSKTTDCAPQCSGPSGSGGSYAAHQLACDATGQCSGTAESGGDFVCVEESDEPACLTACQVDDDCVKPLGFAQYCSAGECVACLTDAHCGANAYCDGSGQCQGD